MEGKASLWALRFQPWSAFTCIAADVERWVLTDTWLFQQRESLQLQYLLDQCHTSANDSAARTIPTSLKGPPVAAIAGLIGRIEIARLGLSAMAMEGADRSTLGRAVGHIPGTTWLGQNGNMVLTCHRGTFFRPLRNISRDDIIALTTSEGEYRYRVLSTQVVSPDNLSMLDPSRNEILTLITCHLFYFVGAAQGAAPNRFIVRAEGSTELENRHERNS